MDIQSLEPHAVHKHVPAKCGVTTACPGCPLAQTPGHESAAEFYPKEPAAENELINGMMLARWQHRIWRKNFDAEGIKAMACDAWYSDNGRDTINYVYFQTYEVTGAVGNTLTLAADGFDAREFTRSTWTAPSPDDLTGIIKVTGYKGTGCVQPLAVGRFSENSLGHGRCWPVVYQVTQSSEGGLTLVCDKNVEAGLTRIDPEESEPITVSLYLYASPENWQHIIRPDYFYGIERMRIIPAAEVPEDGVITLETTAVMHPWGFDPLRPCFTLEGRLIEGGTWETVPQELDRLFVQTAWGKIALKTTKPDKGRASLTLVNDLTELYDRFRVTWWRKAMGTESNCQVLGYARCKHSLPDYSGSMGTGYTGDGIGNGYYCESRLIDEHTLTDEHNFVNPGDPPDGIRDTATHYHRSATGVFDYPSDGQCAQYNCCDEWTGAEGDIGRKAPFQFSKHIGYVTREIWGAANHRRYQPTPTVDQWQLERIMHPSLAYLAGYLYPSTPTGIHPQAEFSGNGGWAAWKVETDEDGNESIVATPGPFEAFNPSDPEANEDGQFPAKVSGWKTVRDPLNAAATMEMRDLDRIGIGIERDTGQMVGPGVSQRSFATAKQNIIIVSNVDAELTDTLQVKPNGTFKRLEDGSAEVRLIALRQESKGVETIGSRTVAAVNDLGDGLIEYELDNVWHTRKMPVPLMGEDDGPSWQAGGGAPIYGDTHTEIVNYYETDKSTGSKLRGAWRGDGLQIGDRLFVIEKTEAFAGSEAPDWGPGASAPDDTWSLDLIYTSYAKKRDIVRVLDDDQGTAAAMTVGATVSFVRSAVVMLPGVALEWTAYGTDDWQTVEGAVCWYGEGLWEIPEAWFDGKPQMLCFRVVDVEWMDHRGAVPGDLINKTDAAIDALEWVRAGLAGAAGSLEHTWRASQRYGYSPVETPCNLQFFEDEIEETDYDVSLTRSGFTLANMSDGGPEDAARSATLSIKGSGLGRPPVLARIPEGTEVLEAWAEVMPSNVTRNLNGVETDVDTGLNFTVLAVGAGKTFTTVGSVATDASKNKVVNITAIIQAMMNEDLDDSMGYVTIFSPIPFSFGMSMAQYMPGQMDPEWGVYTGGECDGQPRPEYSGYYYDALLWEGLALGQIVVKLKYPDEEKARALVMPMWPSMAPAVEP